jgi:hypothetical protein
VVTKLIDYPDQTEKVILTREEYDEMIKRLHWLDCLEQCGLESWSGCDEAELVFGQTYTSIAAIISDINQKNPEPIY